MTDLSARSADFRRIWDTGEVVWCAAGGRRIRHSQAGTLMSDYESLQAAASPGETGLVLHVFSAGEGTADAVALARLAEKVGADTLEV
ncbi:hypothetical protein [Nocardiopsis sp. CNT312]|uniref:MmyB family transcriptional regulator n=1 Tax=Nocardiopsis sp. CNT312 TaxID=1137268 RepID=UPI001E6528E9|nr:hypothetical protein [Nocardiopsis sp. CNT312]